MEPNKKWINYRGILRFWIPEEWSEQHEGPQGELYFAPVGRAGTLRVHVITLSAPSDVNMSDAARILEKTKVAPGKAETLANGNAFLTFRKEAEENGQKGTISFWVLCGVLPPRNARVATFSYAVPNAGLDERVADEVSLLTASCREAVFASVLGV